MAGALVPLAARDQWERSLEGVAHGFTHTWEHCRALALTTGLDTYLWCLEEGPDRLICPLMERPFDEFRDLATPPGISGFAGVGDYERLRAGWEQFTRENGYVAGYIGLHPLFSPQRWQSVAVAYNSLYILDLRQPVERLLQRMDRNRRRELRANDQLSTRIVTDRARLTNYLREMYDGFATRISLRPGERWTDATVEALCTAPTVLMVGVEGTDGIGAAHLYGYTTYAADFVLQIADAESRSHTAGLIWHAARHFKEMGIPFLNLGGGVHDGDPIAQAKQRFGADRYQLTALREVYDPEAYALLCQRTGVQPETSGYFPAYRGPALGGGS